MARQLYHLGSPIQIGKISMFEWLKRKAAVGALRMTFDMQMKAIKASSPENQRQVAAEVVAAIDKAVAETPDVFSMSLPALTRIATLRRQRAVADGVSDEADPRYATPSLLEAWYTAATAGDDHFVYVNESIALWTKSLGVERTSPQAREIMAEFISIVESIEQRDEKTRQWVAGYLRLSKMTFLSGFGSVDAFRAVDKTERHAFLGGLVDMESAKQGLDPSATKAPYLIRAWLCSISDNQRDMEAMFSVHIERLAAFQRAATETETGSADIVGVAARSSMVSMQSPMATSAVPAALAPKAAGDASPQMFGCHRCGKAIDLSTRRTCLRWRCPASEVKG